MVPWPSGKAEVCKTSMRRFDSDWYLTDSSKGLFFVGYPCYNEKKYLYETNYKTKETEILSF